MVLSAQQYNISNWVGFSFGLLSLLLSLLTLYIIYLMCRKKSNTLERKGEDFGGVGNPMNNIKSTEIFENSITDRPSEPSKLDPSYKAAVNNPGGELKTTKFNGYLLLIASTTICQCLYDLNYVLGITHSYSGCIAWHFLDLVGGMSVAIWTNVLSFVIYYVVTYIQSVDIFHSYPYFFAMAVIFPLVIASLEISIPGNFVKRDDDEGCKGENTEYILEDIYYWVRIGSILLNVVVFAVITIKLRRMAIYKHTTSVSLGDGDTPSKHKSFFSTSSRRTTDVLDEPSAAIHELVRRMKYYPIVQVLVRSGAAWNEFDGYKYSTFTSEIMASICSPSTGACYFFLFLYMQPKAFAVFCSLFCWRSPKESSHSRSLRELSNKTTITLRADSFSFNELDEDELEVMIGLSADINTTPRKENPHNFDNFLSNPSDCSDRESRNSFSVFPQFSQSSNRAQDSEIHASKATVSPSSFFSTSYLNRESDISGTKSAAHTNNDMELL